MVSDAQHTPPGDRSFAASVVRHLVTGAALIAVVALVFWGIGRFRGPTTDGPVISAPTDTATDPSPEPSPQDTAVETSPDPTATGPSPAATAEVASPTEAGSPDDARSSISVQVLDATGGDDGRLQAVVDELRELGYQVVATNRAVRTYERSTVFYSEGHRDDALLIREDIPELSVVEEKPGNLTDRVDTHVVVGEDYPES